MVWGVVELGGADRVLLPMTIAFNVLLPTRRWFWPLWALGNLTVAHGGDRRGLIAASHRGNPRRFGGEQPAERMPRRPLDRVAPVPQRRG